MTQPNHDPTAFQQRFQATLARNRARYLAEANKDTENWQYIETVYPQLKHAWEYAPNEDRLEIIGATQIYQGLQGLWEDEKTWLENALTFTNDKDKGTILNNLGLLYSNTGQRKEALHYYKQAFLIDQKMENKVSYAITLNNLGGLYKTIGQLGKALYYYEQALHARLEIGDKAGYAETLNNIGMLYRAMDKHKEALYYCEQALPIAQVVGDKDNYAIILNNLGMLHHNIGKYKESLLYYEQTLPIMQEIGNKAGYATTLNNLGLLYYDMGQYKKAFCYYKQALPIHIEVGNRDLESITRYNMALVYYVEANLVAVVIQLRQSVAIAEAIQSPYAVKWKGELVIMEQKLAEAGQSVA